MEYEVGNFLEDEIICNVFEEHKFKSKDELLEQFQKDENENKKYPFAEKIIHVN